MFIIEFNYDDDKPGQARGQCQVKASTEKEAIDKAKRYYQKRGRTGLYNFRVNNDGKKYYNDAIIESKINEGEVKRYIVQSLNFDSNYVETEVQEDFDSLHDAYKTFHNLVKNTENYVEIVDTIDDSIIISTDELDDNINESKINEISDNTKQSFLRKRIRNAKDANTKFNQKYPNNLISISKDDPRAEEWLKDSKDAMNKTTKARRAINKLGTPKNESKIECANKLEKIARAGKDVKIRQKATSLLDAMNLGADVKDDVKKFLKDYDKETKHESTPRFLRRINKNQLKGNKMSIISKMTEQLNRLINEVSDDTVDNANVKRAMNLDQARTIEREKFKKYSKARDNFENSNLDDAEYDKYRITKNATENEWKNAKDNVSTEEKKYLKNNDLTIRRAMRKAKHEEKVDSKTYWVVGPNGYEDGPYEDVEYAWEKTSEYLINNGIEKELGDYHLKVSNSSLDEEFSDEMTMLTDINDLDFPSALEDTVETDEEGELLTLGKISDQINDLKDEIVDQIEDIKDDLKDEIEDIKDTSSDLTDEELADIEDIDFNDSEEPTDLEPTEPAEVVENNVITDETIEEDDEEDLGESLKPYLRTGKYEDLNKTKSAIDKAINSDKSAKNVKNTIELMSKDDDEADEATEYAVGKLKEQLLATTKSSKLQNI